MPSERSHFIAVNGTHSPKKLESTFNSNAVRWRKSAS